MVITRIAPSPTGKFHIGTARTALFSYLFAKKNGGKFLLRIEDTDRARSSEEHITDIKESLNWLGLHWDNKDSEHYQSKNLDRYQAVAKELLEKGYAYEQEGAIRLNVKFLISNLQSNPKSKIQNLPHPPSPYQGEAKEGLVSFTDLICGEVSFGAEDIEDFVILKSDGWPTYHLAVVVDDHDMNVTHVIRGADHLSNTPKHILLYRALDWKLPQWGHLPLILNSNRTKMSKRHDPVSVTDDFKNQGFLPEAMVNFLAFLGWNPKTEEEFFTLKELEERFDISGIQKSNAVFDSGRLRFMNAHYLRQKSHKELVEMVGPLWAKSYDIERFDDEYLAQVAALVSERATTIGEMACDVDYFFIEPKLDIAELIFKKSTKENTLRGLRAAAEVLKDVDQERWRKEDLGATLSDVAPKENLQNGDVFWPVRYALSGRQASPKPEELLAVLGKDRSLKRLAVAGELLDHSGG